MSESLRAVRAQWLFSGEGPPLAGGVLTLKGDRIVAIGRQAEPGATGRDLGECAILPGLVNAHTHLEFSGLAQPLAPPGTPFPAWIRHVVEWRREARSPPGEAIAAGSDESLRTGTTLLGEIAAGDGPRGGYAGPPDVVVFQELLGLAESRRPANLARAEAHLAEAAHTAWRAGLSPHAPYTVGERLLEDAVRLANERPLPLAMHLAESPEEMELLATGRGPLVELLESLGAWDPAALPRDRRPLDYLRRLAQAPRALVIHGNYLAAEEWDFLASCRDRLAVVYCPRTHAYFRHPRHPLPELLARGVTVALGTDSRASNPDLSLLAELRQTAGTFPELPGETVLRLGTANGAEALGCGAERGRLAPGLRADFLVQRLAADRDPWRALWEGEPSPAAVCVAGRAVHDPGRMLA